MGSRDLRQAIIRILKRDEMTGYSVYKSLLMKGVQTWPNHVYTLLIQMENDNGLLKSRWVGDGKKGAPRRHLYSLNEAGNDEYETILRNSLGVLMEDFFEQNLSMEDLPFHMELVKEALGGPARWSKSDSFKLVIASPSYHPLVCFPKFYYAVSKAYPNSSIFVVRSPWEMAHPLEERKNLTFLDGSRDDIPLKDCFADYVLLQGFPRSTSVADTIAECLRVLKDDGCLFAEVPLIMAVERRVTHNTIFPEYVLRMFYELCGQDRKVKIEDVKRILSASFMHMGNIERRGRTTFFASNKRTSQIPTLRPVRN